MLISPQWAWLTIFVWLLNIEHNYLFILVFSLQAPLHITCLQSRFRWPIRRRNLNTASSVARRLVSPPATSAGTSLNPSIVLSLPSLLSLPPSLSHTPSSILPICLKVCPRYQLRIQGRKKHLSVPALTLSLITHSNSICLFYVCIFTTARYA